MDKKDNPNSIRPWVVTTDRSELCEFVSLYLPLRSPHYGNNLLLKVHETLTGFQKLYEKKLLLSAFTESIQN